MTSGQYSNIRALLSEAPSTIPASEIVEKLPSPISLGDRTEILELKPAVNSRRKIDFLADALREKQSKRSKTVTEESISSVSVPAVSLEYQSEPVPLPVETEYQTTTTSGYSNLVSLLLKPSPPANSVRQQVKREKSTEREIPPGDLSSFLNVSEPFSLSPRNDSKASKPQAKELTAPKLSRHNDAAYYPNIQCILCQEWVCSRNRYMHIESHLQYRPYSCSQCGYDNRKEIFINLHIKRSHNGVGHVVYNPNADLEHRAWEIAEQCLQHTRKILLRESGKESTIPDSEASPSLGTNEDTAPELDPSLLESYETAYRPKIHNSQRLEKSQLIEESRQLGIVPDFSEVADKEEQCRTCGSHILRHSGVLEEHVRTHLSQPSYLCNIDGCSVEHHSKNFISRHMKEVHKYRKTAFDLLEDNPDLVQEFLRLCQSSFPEVFDLDTIARARYRLTNETSLTNFSSPSLTTTKSSSSLLSALLSKKPSISDNPPELKTCEFRPNHESARSPQFKYTETCLLCYQTVTGKYTDLFDHVKTHLKTAPYQCCLCGFSGPSKKSILLHIFRTHKGSPETAGAMVRSGFTAEVRGQCDMLMQACFPSVEIQSKLHDPVEEMGSHTACNLCQKEILARDKKRHAELHLTQPILKCHYCPFKHSVESAMNYHTRQEHKSDMYLIATPSASTNRGSQIEIMMDECFVKNH